jgi:hypothetical protein
MTTTRPTLSGAVDEDTLDNWHAFADAHNVTLSALLEGIGRQLDPQARRLPVFLVRALAEARRVKSYRKDRRPVD